MTQYDDIIRLPHHVSKRHPPMSILARAAQFAPFAACSAEMPGRSPLAQTPLPGMNMEKEATGSAPETSEPDAEQDSVRSMDW